MNGQWIGVYSGTNTGVMIVDIDELARTFRGVAYLNEHGNTLPRTAAIFETTSKLSNQTIEAEVVPIHPNTLMIDTWERVKGFYHQNVVVPNTARVKLRHTKNFLYLQWICIDS